MSIQWPRRMQRRTWRNTSGSHAATVGIGALSHVRKCPLRP